MSSLHSYRTFVSHIGIGKTTFANEICLKWAMDTNCFLSKEYDLVILIRLRTVQERALQQVMIDTVGSKVAYSELLAKCDGNRCLIVLEGLDEVSVNWQENDTMFCQLLKTTTLLSHANILVTSRPHACIHLYEDIKNYARTIEIVGFDKPQIKKYTESFFHNSNTAEKFMEQINNDPHISSLCYVPLCLNMVLECFKYNNETLYTTLTELYQSFVISKVVKNIKHASLGTVLMDDKHCIKTLFGILNDVPGVLSKEALETMFLLSKLAYKSYFEWSEHILMEGNNPRIIYTTKDLAQCNITNFDNDACGLLKVTNTLFATGNTAVYTFNHLSVQEYFCALHISLLPEDQQLWLLKDHINEYPHMWPFDAGITKLKSADILGYLCKFLLQNEKLVNNNIVDYTDIAVNLGLLNNTPLHSFYEAQLSSHVCRNNIYSLFMYVETLCPYDYMSISYFVSIAATTHLILRKCHMGDQEAEILCRCKSKIPSLKVLDLSKNTMTHKGMESIVTIIKNSANLTHLSMAHNPIGNDGIQLFSNLEFECLIQLNIRNIEITEVGAFALCDCLELNNSLQSLEISNNNIGDKGLTKILNTIPSTLVRVIASNCNLTCGGAENIGETLRTNKTLKFFEISKNSIGDKGISVISDNLHYKKNKTLIQLVVDSCEFHTKGAESIGKMLKANKTLKFLNISNNHIGDVGTTAVVSGIKTNTSTALIELNISGCEFHSKGTENIADVLKKNKTLRSLNISKNHIGDNEMSTLAHGIQDNTTLTELDINSTFNPNKAYELVNKTLAVKILCHSVSDGWVHVTYVGINGNNWRIDAGGTS